MRAGDYKDVAASDNRQADRERGSLAWGAFDLDLALVRLDDPPNDREPQAGASGIDLLRGLAAEETFEHVRQVRLGDAGARVGDRQPRFSRSRGDGDENP